MPAQTARLPKWARGLEALQSPHLQALAQQWREQQAHLSSVHLHPHEVPWLQSPDYGTRHHHATPACPVAILRLRGTVAAKEGANHDWPTPAWSMQMPVRSLTRDLRYQLSQEEQDAELRYLEENSSAFEEQNTKPEADPLQEVCSALLRG